MESIKELEKAIDKLESKHQVELAQIEKKLEKRYFESFSSMPEISTLIDKLENSTNYLMPANNDWPCQWISCEDFLSKFSDKQKEALNEYLNINYCCYIEEDSLILNNGPAIIINHDGDCLDQDSNVWFLDKKDYNNEKERNELIEDYMEKTGVFPGVFFQDYHGTLTLISTQGC